MDDQVRERLSELIAEHGRSMCTSPRAVGMMLRQQCPNADGPIHELELALSTGCIDPMLVSLPELADGPAIVQKLVDATGLPVERAQWAVESWTLALMREQPESSGMKRDWSAWNRLDVRSQLGSGTGLAQQAITHMIIVAVAGAIGGAVLGLGLFLRDDWRAIPAFKHAVEDLPAWAREISVGVLGVLGGGAGGLLGWILGGGSTRTSRTYGGTSFGHYGLAAAWACLGGVAGAAGGLAAFGLIGVAVGSLTGTFLGAALGVLAGRGLSRLWN